MRETMFIELLLAVPALAIGDDDSAWNKAKIAIFYREPFGRTPHWAEHLIAYVRGAHLVKSLPEVPETKRQHEGDP
ncbi:MAG: hypothetical protein H8E44_17580 [Planctomycetes bacterium]|nr:hypothetical protein [Planctomycetota bacterium]MBL7037587.1 hypothetical protein [Pirellulaceae bacterium]